jgi:SAM-dependent methyltransferase
MSIKRFSPSDIKTAKEIILTPDDTTTDDRWEKETEWCRISIPAFLEETQGYLSHVPHIVDFGCGIGRTLKAIYNEIPICIFTGIDSSHEMRVLAKEYLGDLNVNLYSGFHNLSDSSVDLVTCLYVLQHVNKNELLGILREIRRVLRPTGRLYLLNLRGRCVPVTTEEESAASDPVMLNEAISNIARNPSGAWENDLINIPQLVHSMFTSSRHVDLPSKYFSELTRGSHDSILYYGIKK